jgi:hypothetical protein
MAYNAPIYGRVTDLSIGTPIPLGIQQLSQKVQVLINFVLAIQEHFCSL